MRRYIDKLCTHETVAAWLSALPRLRSRCVCRCLLGQRLRCSFRYQNKPSYYYEKRFPILYISQYYIYRINFHQRGCNLDVCSMISTKPRAPIDPCARSGLHAGHRIATTSDSTGQPKRVDEDPKHGCRVSTTPRPCFGSGNEIGNHETHLLERFSSICAASTDVPGVRT